MQPSNLKEVIAALRAKCKHDWVGVGAEGLGGYSAYECSKCGQAAGVGGKLRS